MTILFVMESYGLLNNGTSATAQRFCSELRKLGHTVRVLGVKADGMKDDKDYYGLVKYNLPFFQFLCDNQGFAFTRTDDYETIVKAMKGVDVIHLFLPFPLEHKVRLLAHEMHIPVTCAFHLQPENITYTLYMGKSKTINNTIYKYFYLSFYKYIRHVHCPSHMIANQLKKHHYVNNVTHVISNGVSPFFHPIKAEKPKELKDKFIILMIGRLSREKRQDLLIKAIGASKYNKQIQLILCGQGPNKLRLEKLAEKELANPLITRFTSQEELRQIINYSDLYVHSSDAEIEAIACIEAFTCGLVPVISDSPISATNQFALDPHCLFKHGKYKSLTQRIDYFIEHPEEKEKLSKAYIESSKEYALDEQVKRLVEVFHQAIKESKEGKDLASQEPSKKEKKQLEALQRKLIKALGHHLNATSELEAFVDKNDF